LGVGDCVNEERSHREIGEGDEKSGASVTPGSPGAHKGLATNGRQDAGGAETNRDRRDAYHQEAVWHLFPF
jgi:hypothetical protein